ncbi:hypothetical protein [Agromyces seonyuensis]|uniref:Uncharacterized protein n=1 Tax=Agromyces seonyuensis TaxID=2662446 RepID=A0A6I4NYE9_9MICO|nr:hypothetical protein [Agromyces seonyuensis]MWB98202.1 hypothetical protein [Agromyces seonyuensis]
MDRSPGGHEISVVLGDAAAIRTRGRDIVDFGEQMTGAAGVLRAMADGAAAQEGLSIEQVVEVIGEIDRELALAAERYRPSGAALVVYADVLAEVQRAMRPIVASCQTAWDDYARAEQANTHAKLARFAPMSITVAADPSARELEQRTRDEDAADAQRAMDDAHADFVTAGVRFDGEYETWANAFDLAADSIQDATDGGISDGFWDDVDGFVEVLQVVLTYAGVVLAIAAFVIGGPIIAAIGAVVAIAALIATTYQWRRGDAELWEVGVAVIGVIPFGSIAKFSGGFKSGAVAMLDGFTGGLGTASGRTTLRLAVTGFDDVFQTSRVFGAGRWTSLMTSFRGSSGLDDIAARLMGMGFADEAADAATNGWGAAGLVLGHYGWVVNSPVQLGKTVYDFIADQSADRQVETWEGQLAS